MAYLIGEVTKELLETVHEFCEKEVRDLCRECDRSGEVPLGLFRQAMELQFHMLDIPECYGGLGLDKISAGALLEEMAKADAGFAVTFAASSLGLKPILFAGSEELKKEAKAAFPGMDIPMHPLSRSVACHIGHGALAVACSKKVTV